MNPVTQTRIGERGNCFAACLASVFETALPEFGLASSKGYDQRVDAWLARRGYRYMQVPASSPPPVGWHTIEGLSPRGGMHAVVGWNGKMRWDPHPVDGTRHGLDRVERWGLLMPTKGRVEDSIRLTPDKDGDYALRYSVGSTVKLPNGKTATVRKATRAVNLFGEPELHVATRTGEVLPIKIKGKDADNVAYVVYRPPGSTAGVVEVDGRMYYIDATHRLVRAGYKLDTSKRLSTNSFGRKTAGEVQRWMHGFPKHELSR